MPVPTKARDSVRADRLPQFSCLPASRLDSRGFPPVVTDLLDRVAEPSPHCAQLARIDTNVADFARCPFPRVERLGSNVLCTACRHLRALLVVVGTGKG